MKKKSSLLPLILGALILSGCNNTSQISSSSEIKDEGWVITSPDETIKINTKQKGGELYWNASKDGDCIIADSLLGITTTYNYFSNLKFIEKNTNSKTFSYSNITGKRKNVTTSYNEMILTFLEDNFYLDVTFRVYDDGYAFRYSIRSMEDSVGNFTISSEETHFTLPSDAYTWGMPYKNSSIFDGIEYFSYEENYQYISYKNIKDEKMSLPLLYKLKNKDTYSLLMESDIYGKEYHGSFLQKDETGSFVTIHAPACGKNPSYEASYPFTSPWRVGIVGTLETIVESTLVEDVYDDIEPWKPDNYEELSEEEKAIYTYDWVTPGVGVWNYLNYPEGENQDRQNDWELQKSYVDLVERMGWTWLVLDAGWNIQLNDDFKDFMAYAKSKNVKIMVWANIFTYFTTRESTQIILNQWADLGIEGVKIDFFDGQGEDAKSENAKMESKQTLEMYEMFYQECAKRKMVVDCHGSNKPTGERRKYPNVINREAIRGNEFKNVSASQTVLLPYIRGTVGPSDFTPATIPYYENTVTLGHNLALCILLESGMPTVSDVVSHYVDVNYEEFYKNLPAVWDDTKLIAGDLETYCVIARKSNNAWYVGGNVSVANTITVDLSFLDEGTYSLQGWVDGNKYTEVNVLNKEVTNKTKLEIPCSKGGGFALIIK